MVKVCKRHADNPVKIYHQCVGCELEWLREELEQKQQEIDRLKKLGRKNNGGGGMRKIDGRKAVVIDNGHSFPMYRTFAERYGYPDAVGAQYRLAENGDEVTLLVSGKRDPLERRTLWIVERTDGERFIIGEEGLRIEPS